MSISKLKPALFLFSLSILSSFFLLGCKKDNSGNGNTNVTATGITLNPIATVSLAIGDTFRYHANVVPSNAAVRTINWSVSKTTVASVSQDGLVTALASGFANVRAATIDGAHRDSSSVAVNTLTNLVDCSVNFSDLGGSIEGVSLYVSNGRSYDMLITKIVEHDKNGAVYSIKTGSITAPLETYKYGTQLAIITLDNVTYSFGNFGNVYVDIYFTQSGAQYELNTLGGGGDFTITKL